MTIPTQPRRILIVVMRRLGDVLLATALIRSVRRAWPQARLEVLVNAGSAAVLVGNPDIDRLWVQPERAGFWKSLRLAAALWRRFDLSISALYNDRPHLWAFIASPNRAGVVPPRDHPGARWKRWSMDAWCELDLDHVHAVEQYLRIADALGIPRINEVVPPRPPANPLPVDGAAEEAPAHETPRAAEGANEYVVLHPSPLYRYKAWTVEGWRALTRHLIDRGFDVRLTGGSAEAERALLQAIVEGLSDDQRAHVADLGGALPFAALTPLIEGARLFVGPDTSVTHLAAATGTPTVALFGPSHPIAWGPWPARHAGTGASPWVLRAPLQQQGNVWLIQGEAPCVPCRGEGCDKHPGSRSLCLDEMSAERVIGLVEQALARPRVSAAGAVPTST